MPFPDGFLDELVARCDIADVVSGYVPLTPKGRNLWGLCPFHSEKTPSFSVSPEKQIYHCFGCGKGGGVINFIMEMENLPFPEAVRMLAARAGMTVPEDGADQGRRKRERLLEANRAAARFFNDTLGTPEGAAGAEYFSKRGLSKGIITRFGLGAAPDRWDALLHALGKQGFSKQELLDAGLAVKNRNGTIYDRFRNRVIFPIIDARGGVIGFGGRVLDDSQPKYLNTPDTPLFNKRRNLFALNLARKSKLGFLILTEGYMDAVSLHQAGFDNAVAMLGTGCTEEHAQLLSRYTGEVLISGDTDGPGLEAVQRAIRVLEKTGLSVRILRLPGAKDPDEFLRKYGREAFRVLTERAENHIEYRLLQIRAKYDLKSDEQRVAFLKEAVGLVASLPGPVEREVYGARAAEAAGISREAMALEVKRARAKLAKTQEKQSERQILRPAVSFQPKERSLRYENVRSAKAEEGVLRLLWMSPELFRKVERLGPEQFSSPFLGRVFELFAQRYRAGHGISPAVLARELTQEEMNRLTALLQEPESLENAERAMEDYIEIIETELIKREAARETDPLLLAQERYREKKGYGGTGNDGRK